MLISQYTIIQVQSSTVYPNIFTTIHCILVVVMNANKERGREYKCKVEREEKRYRSHCLSFMKAGY